MVTPIYTLAPNQFANKNPVYTLTPNIGMGQVLNANTARDASIAGAASPVFQAGPNGSLIQYFRAVAQGSTVLAFLNLFAVNPTPQGGQPAWGCIGYFSVTAITATATVVPWDSSIAGDFVPTNDIALGALWSIWATVTVAQPSPITVFAMGGDY